MRLSYLQCVSGGAQVASLLYLAIPGSVVGFTAYLLLVGRLGPEKVAYCTVLFPVVALTISTVFEDYHWSASAFIGLGLVLAGNLMAFLPAGWKFGGVLKRGF